MINAVAIQPRFATKRAVVHVDNPRCCGNFRAMLQIGQVILTSNAIRWPSLGILSRRRSLLLQGRRQCRWLGVLGFRPPTFDFSHAESSEPVDGHEPILFPSGLPGKSTGGLQLAHNELLHLRTSLRRVDKNVLSPNSMTSRFTVTCAGRPEHQRQRNHDAETTEPRPQDSLLSQLPSCDTGQL